MGDGRLLFEQGYWRRAMTLSDFPSQVLKVFTPEVKAYMREVEEALSSVNPRFQAVTSPSAYLARKHCLTFYISLSFWLYFRNMSLAYGPMVDGLLGYGLIL